MRKIIDIVSKDNSQKLLFRIISIPLAGLSPLLKLVQTTLSCVCGCSSYQRWWKLEHFEFHQAKLDQEEGQELQLVQFHRSHTWLASVLRVFIFAKQCYITSLTFLSEWAALRNLVMNTYGVGTDNLNCKMFTINFSYWNVLLIRCISKIKGRWKKGW